MTVAGETLRAHAVADLGSRYDHEWGGFSTGAKHPEPRELDLLMRHAVAEADADVLAMATHTLNAIASGGVYDHLGGGFWHAGLDRQWHQPDFEKRLLDQALLCRVYLHAWQITGTDNHLQVAEESLAFVLDTMRTTRGVFISSLDAASEGTVGRYYRWTRRQIESVLGADAPEFCAWYGIDADDTDPGGRVFHRPLRSELRRPATVELSRIRLLSSRDMRVPPARDDTVRATPNAEMLSSLAETALATANHRWLGASTRAAEGLLSHLRTSGGQWLHEWDPTTTPGTGPEADAVDLALLVDAFTRLAEASGTARWIGEAETVADALLERWWSDDLQAFSAPSQAPSLAVDANSHAAVALIRLAECTGSSHLGERGAAAATWLRSQVSAAPPGPPAAIVAIELADAPVTQVVVTDPDEEMLDAVRLRYLPTAVVSWGEPLDSPMWADKIAGAAYLCHDAIGAAPAHTPRDLGAQLDRRFPQPFRDERR